MADKIRSGQVPSITDPAVAKDIVIKGNCTYNQAVNIAKAGTLDSVKFDVKTQSVSCSITCGFPLCLDMLMLSVVVKVMVKLSKQRLYKWPSLEELLWL